LRQIFETVVQHTPFEIEEKKQLALIHRSNGSWAEPSISAQPSLEVEGFVASVLPPTHTEVVERRNDIGSTPLDVWRSAEIYNARFKKIGSPRLLA
jgi:hypothetical protein